MAQFFSNFMKIVNSQMQKDQQVLNLRDIKGRKEKRKGEDARI